jgi:hypothetical protein
MGDVRDDPTTFPNHEELAFAVRSFVGALPILWLAGAVWIVLLALWLANVRSEFFLAAVVALTVTILVAAAVGLRSVRARTPTSIELTTATLVARWSGSKGRLERIPFSRITAVESRRWQWTQGKGAYAQFLPASVQFGQAEAVKDLTGDSLRDSFVYLTDENAERVRTALGVWNEAIPPESSSP